MNIVIQPLTFLVENFVVFHAAVILNCPKRSNMWAIKIKHAERESFIEKLFHNHQRLMISI